MRAGTLREYVELHRPVPPLTPDPDWGTAAPRPSSESEPDAGGGSTLYALDGYAHYAHTRASVEPLDGTETKAGADIQTVLTHVVRVRFRRDVRSTDRVLWWDSINPDAPRVLEIVKIIDPNNRHRELVLACKEHPTRTEAP